MFASCGDAESGPGGNSAPEPGSPGNPIPLEKDGVLDWPATLAEIAAAGKYVTLDLSACTGVTEFDPGTANTGEKYIISLVLPDGATGIKEGDPDNPTFKNFMEHKSITGAGVTNVGDVAFRNCAALTTASFPKATYIGVSAFAGCVALTTVSFPKASSIGAYTFYDCRALTTVNLPAATTLWIYNFWNCAALTTVNPPAA
ncbi:MAG: leucine-rich repeat domain-containing protein [Spirochaetaceae bacterium]|nr:leucine-rich repeat domain-containing protein [Spirochaetaceae bacterium]